MQINDENVKLVLSQNIKMSRLALGYTQENVAESSEISVNFLKDIENTRSGISITTLVNLCKSLKSTPNQLLKDFFEGLKAHRGAYIINTVFPYFQLLL